MSKEIVLKDIGPIETLEIKVPEKGGIVVLHGRNGTGKSVAIEAVSKLLGCRKAKPSSRDGAQKGTVDAFGVRMTIASRIRASGSLDIDSLEGRIDLASLVDPGVSDTIAADSRRIKSLISLLDIEADEELFRAIAGDLSELGVKPTDDLVELSSRVKRALEKKARDQMARHDKCISVAIAGEQQVAKIDDGTIRDAKVLTKALEAAVESNAGICARANAVDAAIKARAEASEAFGELPVVSVELKQRACDEASTELGQAETEVAKAEARIEAARIKLIKERSAYTMASESLRVEKGREEESKRIQEILDAAVPDIVTDEELAAASRDVEAASTAIELGTRARNNDLLIESIEKARADAKTFARAGAIYRDNADSCDGVLSDIIGRLDIGLKVIGGLLHTETPRGMTPFGELSDGERWKLAIDLGMSQVGPGAVLAIGQEAYEGLDDANRAMINAHAIDRGVTILTASSDSGDIRAETFEAE